MLSFLPRSRSWIIAASLILTGGGAVLLPRVLPDGSAPAGAAPGPEPEVTWVRTTRVSAPVGVELSSLRSTGTLRPGRELAQSFAVRGVVAQIAADEGDAVRSGAMLGRLDPVPFEAEVERAEARLRFLDARLARSEELLRAKAISAEEADADRAERAAVAAQLRQARWQLERSVLRAPFDARVRSRALEVGQVVAPGTTVIELVAVDTLEVEVAVGARELGRLDLAAPVTLRSPDRPGESFRGWIDHTPVSGDARSGSVPLLVNVAGHSGRLLPGLLVECSFASRSGAQRPSHPRIPVSAVRVADEGPVVFRVEEGRARRVAVELGDVRDSHVEVVAGLSPGDVVVADAPDRLRDGDSVLPREEG